MSKLLIEIGTEELPPSFVDKGREQLKEKITGLLRERKIGFGSIKEFSTPRRLSILIDDVSPSQDEWEEEVYGPPKKVAYDEKGNPTKALLGFIRAHGIEPSHVYLVRREKGEYVAAKRKAGGGGTFEILKKELPAILESIEFPKTMRWKGSYSFARPVRWIVALFDNEVIEFEAFGIKSGRETRGHLILSKGKIRIDEPSVYERLLEENFVIPDPSKRLERIKKMIEEEAKRLGGFAIMDEELLNEVTNLVEFPSVISGHFDDKYLSLPPVVVVTALKQHQRYFSVRGRNGGLLPFFLAVVNTKKDFESKIRPGLEKVLLARLEDAEFYFQEDKKKRLEERVHELKGIVWKEGLGTVYEKVMRVKELSLFLSSHDREVDREVLERGALLSKTDLTTEMIRDGKEFTKLEGIIGMEYALLQGEEEKVARIIYEHRLPRFAGDELPTLREAVYLGIADRLDSLSGIVSTGYEPKGSQDPLGLRRITYGLIEIILSHSIRIDLKQAIREATKPFDGDQLIEKCLSFIFSRFETYLEEREGIRYDLVDSIIGTSYDLVNLRKRASALKKLMEEDEETFERVVIGQKRVANILSELKEEPKLDENLLKKKEEKNLIKKAKEVEPLVKESVDGEKFEKALLHLLSLRESIDSFFDNVFVMVEDRRIRRNRLSLLHYIRSIFRYYADFSKIVVAGEENSGKGT